MLTPFSIHGSPGTPGAPHPNAALSTTKGKALTHTQRHIIHKSSVISARGHFLNACSCCLTSGFAFPSFARSPLSPGHTSGNCQPTSGNCFPKSAHLCYLCADTLLKEPLDWKHSTGKRNGTSHPAAASFLLLWGMSVSSFQFKTGQKHQFSAVVLVYQFQYTHFLL